MKHALLRNNVLFALLQSLYWSAFCLTTSFLALYLEANSYAKGEIGAILSASAVTVLFGQYVWGSVCYKVEWLSHRTIILLCFLVGIAVNVLMPLMVFSFLATLLLYSLFTFTFSSMAPMIDAWIMFRKLDIPKLNYGLTRGFGSGVYALIAVYFGDLFTRVGIESMFVFSSMFIAAALLTSLVIQRGSVEESRTISTVAGFKGSIGLMRNARYLLFVVSVLIIFTAFTANSSFYALLITELGGDSGDFGVGIFLMAMSEVPVMFLSAWLLTRIPARYLLILSFFFFVVKAVLLAVSANVTAAVLAQLAQSLSFGLFLPVCVVYLDQIVSRSQYTLAYMLIASTCYGFGGILGNALGGIIAEYYSLHALFQLNVLVTLAGLLLFLFSLRRSTIRFSQ